MAAGCAYATGAGEHTLAMHTGCLVNGEATLYFTASGDGRRRDAVIQDVPVGAAELPPRDVVVPELTSDTHKPLEASLDHLPSSLDASLNLVATMGPDAGSLAYLGLTLVANRDGSASVGPITYPLWVGAPWVRVSTMQRAGEPYLKAWMTTRVEALGEHLATEHELHAASTSRSPRT